MVHPEVSVADLEVVLPEVSFTGRSFYWKLVLPEVVLPEVEEDIDPLMQVNFTQLDVAGSSEFF